MFDACQLKGAFAQDLSSRTIDGHMILYGYAYDIVFWLLNDGSAIPCCMLRYGMRIGQICSELERARLEQGCHFMLINNFGCVMSNVRAKVRYSSFHLRMP